MCKIGDELQIVGKIQVKFPSVNLIENNKKYSP